MKPRRYRVWLEKPSKSYHRHWCVAPDYGGVEKCEPIIRSLKLYMALELLKNRLDRHRQAH